MTPFWSGFLFGSCIGVQIANTLYFWLLRRMGKRFKADLAAIKTTHAEIERNLLTVLYRQRGEGLPPELRQ